MHLSNILTSDAVITVAATLFGGLWTAFKSSEWFNRAKRKRHAKAVGVLEVAVDDTYRTYVTALKEGRADGKLTAEEKQRARALARARAHNIARNQGVDVVRELGREYIDLWISKLVKKLKK